jgi:acyl-CoA thioester hydrolase
VGAFVHSLRVRYGECDAQGIVFNANYLSFFDVAMTELWREAVGRWDDFAASGTDMVVAEARVRYRVPARFDDVISVEAGVGRLGDTSMLVVLRILRDGELLTEGDLRYVFIDPATGAKKRMPDDVRAALEPYRVPAGGEDLAAAASS